MGIVGGHDRMPANDRSSNFLSHRCGIRSDFELQPPTRSWGTEETLQQEETETSIKEETETWIKERALVIQIGQESYEDHRLSSDVSIFRVPNFLKDLKMKAYVPQIVSLGPYHYMGENVCPMEYHKRRALHRMMTRFNNRRGATDPDNRDFSVRAIETIFKDVYGIRNRYEAKIDLEPQSLAVMLTLDGCFILEILRTLVKDKVSPKGSDETYEPIFERRKIQFTGFDILNDILMLENQIPFIVLKKLLQLEVENGGNFLFDVLVKTPATKFYPFDYDQYEWSWPQQVEQVHHFLGLLYELIVPPPSLYPECTIQIDMQRKDLGNRQQLFSPAVELSNAGIKFKRCNGGIKQIFFDWREATMYLPPINVTDYTEVLFRNLVALELCQASQDNYVTCYLSLMNNLINSDKDVGLLRNSGIIKNYLGSDAEVSELFHGLCKGVTDGLCKGVTVPRQDIFDYLQRDVMNYYESKFRVLFAKFKKTYFSAWTIPVILGLLLTLVQTIYAIVQH